MKTWIVSAHVTIGIWTRVEADTAEDAIEQSAERQMMSLCHQCAGEDNADDEFVTGGELDGEPQKLTAREER